MPSRHLKRLEAHERSLNPEETHAGISSVPATASEAEIDEILSNTPPATWPYGYILAPATADPDDWQALVAQQMSYIRGDYHG